LKSEKKASDHMNEENEFEELFETDTEDETDTESNQNGSERNRV
jgi:hypothetical protein